MIAMAEFAQKAGRGNLVPALGRQVLKASGHPEHVQKALASVVAAFLRAAESAFPSRQAHDEREE
jgi:hypothetical protein